MCPLNQRWDFVVFLAIVRRSDPTTRTHFFASLLVVFSQTYGYEHMLTLNNLEKTGLLKLQTNSRNNYPTIRKTLKLWMEDANEQVSPPPGQTASTGG